jgi:hypothetical protein
MAKFPLRLGDGKEDSRLPAPVVFHADWTGWICGKNMAALCLPCSPASPASFAETGAEDAPPSRSIPCVRRGCRSFARPRFPQAPLCAERSTAIETLPAYAENLRLRRITIHEGGPRYVRHAKLSRRNCGFAYEHDEERRRVSLLDGAAQDVTGREPAGEARGVNLCRPRDCRRSSGAIKQCSPVPVGRQGEWHCREASHRQRI